MIFLFPMNFFIQFGICSTPKVSKWVTILSFTCKVIQWVPTDLKDLTHQDIYTLFFVLSKLFLEKTSLNLASIWWHYCISKLV